MTMKRAASCFGKADLPRRGRPLRDLHQAFGLTQALTAALAGLAENTLGAVQAGRSGPRLPTIAALSATRGVNADHAVAAAAVTKGCGTIIRAGKPEGDLSLGLAEIALRASALSVLQGQRHSPQPAAATTLRVRDGVVIVTTASGERPRLEAGDTCHAGNGAISFLAGPGAELARLPCVADPRRRMERE